MYITISCEVPDDAVIGSENIRVAPGAVLLAVPGIRVETLYKHDGKPIVAPPADEGVDDEEV